MIVATAQLYRMPVLTSDRLIAACTTIEVVW
jgi:hypothetical protein